MRYRTPGAVVGFKAEAKILRHWPGPVVCSGAQVTQAMIQAEQILASGCDALLSFGIAGGLVAGMRPGSIIIATGVTHGKHISPCDAGWSAALASALPKAHPRLNRSCRSSCHDTRGKERLTQGHGSFSGRYGKLGGSVCVPETAVRYPACHCRSINVLPCRQPRWLA